jgi:hypothetical protein
MPPLFPMPNPGDTYYNTTREVFRVFWPDRWVDTYSSNGGGGGGGSGDKTYDHYQPLLSKTWTVVHSLGKYPSITCVDFGGSVVYGTVAHVDDTTLTVTFERSANGHAYCN